MHKKKKRISKQEVKERMEDEIIEQGERIMMILIVQFLQFVTSLKRYVKNIHCKRITS
jgi:hypothetical protein